MCPRSVLSQGRSLNAAASGETIQPSTGVVLGGRLQRPRFTKWTPTPRNRTNVAISRSASSQTSRVMPSAEQKSSGPVWSYVVLWNRVVKHTTPSRYTEQCSEAPPTTSFIPAPRNIQRGSSHKVLFSSKEDRPHYLHPETWEIPGTTFVYRPISLLDTIGKLFE